MHAYAQARRNHIAARPPARARQALPASPAAPSQRSCACGGACSRCAGGALATPPRALNIGAPDDSYEREADRVAATVMGMPATPADATLAARRADRPVSTSAGVMPTSGRMLDTRARRFLEPRFGRDFGHVRVHTDAAAMTQAAAVGAAAFTVGDHVAFAAGEYAPETQGGLALLAHELAHTVQQTEGRAPPAIQRQRPRVEVRSPVVEETLTQVSSVAGGAVGRPLREVEIKHAEAIFGTSIDYGRVRLVRGVLDFVTIGNNIYIPNNYTILHAYHAQTLIHELVHVWQYQHGGTSYISGSIVAQIGGSLQGTRNIAYDYRLSAGDSFYDFNPEQQGLIVENYFAMVRDQAEIATAPATEMYTSNHLDSSGQFPWISKADRLAEIQSELPLHEPLIAQVRASLPQPEIDLLQQRAMDGIQSRGQDLFPVPQERQLTPVRPLLEIRF